MRRLPPVVTCCVALLALAGCGGVGDSRQIADFPSEPPYIPPREPGPRASDTPDIEAEAEAPAEAEAEITSGAPTDEEVARDLREGFGGDGDAASITDAADVTNNGLATTPPSAPAKVATIIRAANQVATRPYRYGGGHGGGPEGIFTDSAYDCSGSVSYALASAGFVEGPMDSTGLARFGKPGPGKWVTIYANAGHAWMTVAGLRFDTSGRRERGSRWQSATRGTGGFTVRHPPGL